MVRGAATARRRAWTVGLAAGLVVVASVAVIARRRAPVWADFAGRGTRILVMPFDADPALSGWSGAALAESLAARLSAAPGLDAAAAAAQSGDADYLLEGDVAADSGRVVIALRLRPAGQRAAAWSATFWRRDLAEPTLVGDLARAVIEALGGTGRTRTEAQSPKEQP
jgi:hypothetical protein